MRRLVRGERFTFGECGGNNPFDHLDNGRPRFGLEPYIHPMQLVPRDRTSRGVFGRHFVFGRFAGGDVKARHIRFDMAQ